MGTLTCILFLDPGLETLKSSLHTGRGEVNTHIKLQNFSVASVLFDFEGRYPDELSVSAGDSVKVIDFVGTEWIKCWNPMTDKSGMVPVGFLQIFFDEDEEPDYDLQSEQSNRFSTTSFAISERSKDEVWSFVKSKPPQKFKNPIL